MNSRFVPDAAAGSDPLRQTPTAAVVTASYAPDFERCRLLCETMDRQVSGVVHHYILVEHRDVALFRQLETGSRTVVDERDLCRVGCVSSTIRRACFAAASGSA
ncbi:hypothetical protein AJ88_13520 [Mesorhizobium amorphae CCBAU 01583]|nr:hypothetical protein AJ88_13520 [Mesorhizobium amorphae CCBAU 01583]